MSCFEVRVDGGAWTTGPLDNGFFTYTTTDLAAWTGGSFDDGEHTLHLKAIDATGNVRTTSLTYILDTDAPGVPGLRLVSKSDTGISNADFLTNDATPTLRLTVRPDFVVRWYRGEVEIARGSVDAEGLFTLPPLPEGLNHITAVAEDRAGNRSRKTNAVSFEVDTLAPQIGWGLAAESDTGPVGDRRTTQATVRLAGQADAGVSIILANTTVAIADANGNFVLPGVPLAVGENAVPFEVVDEAGNTFSSVIRFYREATVATATDTVGTTTGGTANRPPIAVADEYCRAGTRLPSNRVFTVLSPTDGLLRNDSDPDGDLLRAVERATQSQLGATVRVRHDSTFTYDPTAAANLRGLTAYQQMSNSFDYTNTDGRGGTSSKTVTLDLIYDPVELANGTIGDRVFFDRNGNGVDDPGESGVGNVAITLLNAGSEIIAQTTTTSSGAYGFGNLAAGTYRVRFTRPADTELVTALSGTDRNRDSDPDPVTGTTCPHDVGCRRTPDEH